MTDIQPTQLTIGERAIASRTIVWAAGVRASLAARWLEAEHDKAGRIFVDASLAVAGHHRIFAIGDTASAAGLDGHALPGIAPVAKQQGRYVADRILGRRTGPFRYRSFGNLATIGRRQAVIDWNGWHISGSFAWLIWSLAHVWFLVGFRSRLVVGIQWAWNYVTYQRSARLITGERVSTAPNLIHRKTA